MLREQGYEEYNSQRGIRFFLNECVIYLSCIDIQREMRTRRTTFEKFPPPCLTLNYKQKEFDIISKKDLVLLDSTLTDMLYRIADF